MPFDWKRSALIIGLGACAAACADFHRGTPPPDGGDASQDAPIDDPTFETRVYPILELHCQDCHMAGRWGESSALVLTGDARLDRPMVVALVVPGDPADSLLLRRARGELHPGGEVLTEDDSDYQTLADWIMGLPAQR
jgi:hypothetical protein